MGGRGSQNPHPPSLPPTFPPPPPRPPAMTYTTYLDPRYTLRARQQRSAPRANRPGESLPIQKSQLQKLDRYRWLVPRTTRDGMLTDALIYADENLLEAILKDLSIEQAMNVAFLPGIVGRSLAMPDIHQGYGFPIGGVAATNLRDGVVSPGGVGFDINCGVRLLASTLHRDAVVAKLRELVNQLFRDVPSGAGSEGTVPCSWSDLNDVLARGASSVVDRGFGEADDIEFCEESGAMDGADPDKVSDRAKQRGRTQLCTLGSEWDLGVAEHGAHNIAKTARHRAGNTQENVLVHRKGATRSFPVGSPYIPAAYRQSGQPVLIPGSMGTASYVLVGTERAMEETFGTVCHGAGRALSRTAAKRGRDVRTETEKLEAQGIFLRSDTRDGILEEIPEAYKDIDAVVEVVQRAGLARKVARLRPMGVIKG